MNFSSYASTNISAVLKKFEVDPKRGLLHNEIAERRRVYGINTIKESRVSPWEILLRQLKSSFIYLLIGAAVLSFLLREMTEGVMIVIFLLINTFLGFYQEYRSEQTVELLRKFIPRRVKVRREGTLATIPVENLVLGDVVIIEAGNGIPADIRIIEEFNLTVNEEPLMGESVAVKKESSPLAHDTAELHEANNIGFSGTTVVSGRGVGIVFAVGSQTVIGDIARLSSEGKRESKFEQELAKFSKFILYLVLITLAFIFVANILLKGFSTDIVGLAIFSIALAVSVVPEALPVVMTFSLSRGARRLAKNHVVVKRLSAIEDLGSVEIFCTDKTGTLTENKLTVSETCGQNREEIIFAANMGGSYLAMRDRNEHIDPFDRALWEALSSTDQTRIAAYEKIRDIPFDPVRRKNSALLSHEGKTMLIVRGAPEVLLDAVSISLEERAHVLSWMADEGRKGRRTLAVASKNLSSVDYDDVKDEEGLTFIGCVSFVDPIKVSARKAIQDAVALKVGIKIITGDSREVAGTVAYEVGLAKNPEEVMTARELFALNEDDRTAALDRLNVFARVSPEEKYRIIGMFQKKYRVGFLGEGINDAPALKRSNVAIVVDGASDIAREAADIVLLEKSLDVIIGGIREGRAIFANTVKYLRSSLSSNFGNFYAVAISSLFIPFLPMLPLQILLVNLLSDFPAIAIATDNVEPKELQKPKQYDVRNILIFGTILGVISTLFDFITFASFYQVSAESLQTHWFMVSILTELVFFYSIRSRKIFFRTVAPSRTIVFLSLLAGALTIALPFTTFGHTMFNFISPSASSLGFVLGLVGTYFITTEIAKLFYYRMTAPTTRT